MSQRRLENKRILVTGGAGGIGREICRRLAAEGAGIWINYRRNADTARLLRAELQEAGAQSWLARADLCQPQELETLLGDIERQGGLDSVVHCASAPLLERPFTQVDWESFVMHWDTAVRGAYLLVRGCLKCQTAGRLQSVVFILSSAVFGMPPAGKSAYTSAKYALLGLARSMAVELAPKGIRVNCVSPGFTLTGLTTHVDERIQELLVKSVPLKRLCEPRDVAASVAFLLSDDSAYLTGVNLPVCGGTHSV